MSSDRIFIETDSQLIIKSDIPRTIIFHRTYQRDYKLYNLFREID